MTFKDKIIRNERTLRTLSRARKSVRDSFIESAKKEVVDTLIQCAEVILRGLVRLTPSQREKLEEYSDHIRVLVKGGRKIPLDTKKKLLQIGGFLPLLLKPILGLAGTLLGSLTPQ